MEVLKILWEIWDCPAKTKSNLAKTEADSIAIAASEGLITVRQGDGYSRLWRITPRGLSFLWAAMYPYKKPQTLEGDFEDENGED